MDDLLTKTSAVLATTPSRWQALAEKLPASLLRHPAAPGEWSAIECLLHLIDTERLFTERTEAILAGRDFPAFDPDAEGTKLDDQTPDQLASEFARRRSASLSLLARVTAADLDRTGRHAELGPVTLSNLLNEWAAHDLMHTVQAERALMQPFLPGTGPWRSFFRDHDLGA